MNLTEQDLDNLATLSRITIKPEEKEKMLHDMQAILSYISEINEIADMASTSKSEVRNITREDVVTHESGILTGALLNEAPSREGDFVKVAQVFKD